MSHQRIRTRNIHHDIGLFPGRAVTLRIGYGFAGPVARMLVHAGQSVKYRAFPHVRIPRQGNHFVFLSLLFNDKARICRCNSDRMRCQPHCATSISGS